jgi:hypothetical protein
MLPRLKPTGIRDQLDSPLDEAGRANLSARETLAVPCEREITRRAKAAVVLCPTTTAPERSTAHVSTGGPHFLVPLRTRCGCRLTKSFAPGTHGLFRGKFLIFIYFGCDLA